MPRPPARLLHPPRRKVRLAQWEWAPGARPLRDLGVPRDGGLLGARAASFRTSVEMGARSVYSAAIMYGRAADFGSDVSERTTASITGAQTPLPSSLILSRRVPWSRRKPWRPIARLSSGTCNILRVGAPALLLTISLRSPSAEAVGFLIHVVGDMHQPLHCADNHDRGGNEVRVIIGSEDTNLHAVLDTDVVAALGQDPERVASHGAQITSADEASWGRGSAA